MNLPQQSWDWPNPGGGRSGVHTYEGKLVWWHTPSGPNGRFGEVATTQSFADFRAHGAKISGAPTAVLEELRRVQGSE